MVNNTGNRLMLPYGGDMTCMGGWYDYGMIDKLFDHSVREIFVDPMLRCRESLPA